MCRGASAAVYDDAWCLRFAVALVALHNSSLQIPQQSSLVSSAINSQYTTPALTDTTKHVVILNIF